MLTESKPRWERRKEARPKELLSAALDAFVERGFAATKLEEVARNAGVSKGTLYLYFQNKEELFKAVVRNTIVPNIAQAEKLIAEFDGETKDLFRELILLWARQISAVNVAGICKLMFAEVGNFPELAQFYHHEVIQRNELMIIQLLERGMLRGEFRQLDLTVTPKIITAPLVMLMLWSQSFCASQTQPLDVDNYINNYVDTMLAGLLRK
jgi:AcrR family transcriptional regulator